MSSRSFWIEISHVARRETVEVTEHCVVCVLGGRIKRRLSTATGEEQGWQGLGSFLSW